MLATSTIDDLQIARAIDEVCNNKCKDVDWALIEAHAVASEIQFECPAVLARNKNPKQSARKNPHIDFLLHSKGSGGIDKATLNINSLISSLFPSFTLHDIANNTPPPPPPPTPTFQTNSNNNHSHSHNRYHNNHHHNANMLLVSSYQHYYFSNVCAMRVFYVVLNHRGQIVLIELCPSQQPILTLLNVACSCGDPLIMYMLREYEGEGENHNGNEDGVVAADDDYDDYVCVCETQLVILPNKTTTATNATPTATTTKSKSATTHKDDAASENSNKKHVLEEREKKAQPEHVSYLHNGDKVVADDASGRNGRNLEAEGGKVVANAEERMALLQSLSLATHHKIVMEKFREAMMEALGPVKRFARVISVPSIEEFTSDSIHEQLSAVSMFPDVFDSFSRAARKRGIRRQEHSLNST